MKKEFNYASLSTDDSVLVAQREEIKEKIAQLNESATPDVSAIHELRIILDAINVTLNKKSLATSLPFIAGQKLNPVLYPDLVHALKNGKMSEMSSGLPQLPFAEDTHQIATATAKEATQTIQTVATMTVKGGINANGDKIEVLSADMLAEDQSKIRAFLNDKAKSLADFVNFVKEFQDNYRYAGRGIDGILNNVIYPVAMDKKCSKDNLYKDLLTKLISPLDNDNPGSYAARAVLGLGLDFRVPSMVAKEILISMVYQYARMQADGDESKSVAIYSRIFKGFVFNHEEAADDAEIKGFYVKNNIAKATDRSYLIEDLARLSDELSDSILTKEEIEQLKTLKKISFQAGTEAVADIPDVVKDIVKEDPEPEPETPGNPVDHTGGNRKKNKKNKRR